MSNLLIQWNGFAYPSPIFKTGTSYQNSDREYLKDHQNQSKEMLPSVSSHKGYITCLDQFWLSWVSIRSDFQPSTRNLYLVELSLGIKSGRMRRSEIKAAGRVLKAIPIEILRRLHKAK